MANQFFIFPGNYEAHKVAFAELEAQYWRDGFFAKSDYRYWAMYYFVHASPSFRAVANKLRGKACDLPMPVDASLIEDIFKDFFIELGPNTPQTNESIIRMVKLRGPRLGTTEKLAHATDWWNVKGKRLFGIEAQDPSVRVFSQLTSTNKSVKIERAKTDCLAVQISLNQSLEDALDVLAKKLRSYNFSSENYQVEQPKYKLLESSVRRSTLGMALEVLEWYQSGKNPNPMWWIGNYCAVTKTLSFTQEEYDRFSNKERAYRKKRLEIATSRVLRTALLLAENAARGRFPCIDPFPEAQLTGLKRKAGRPKAPAKRKTREVANDPALNAFADADFASLGAAFGSSLPSSLKSSKKKASKSK